MDFDRLCAILLTREKRTTAHDARTTKVDEKGSTAKRKTGPACREVNLSKISTLSGFGFFVVFLSAVVFGFQRRNTALITRAERS